VKVTPHLTSDFAATICPALGGFRRFVSIGSRGWGGAGSSTLSTSSKLAAWMVMM
jgi:hypothetical protein